VAGQRAVIELHGSLSRVVCLDCGTPEARADVQTRIAEQNPGLRLDVARFAPDGDADVEDDALATFVVPCCLRCGGPLKPDVVFFGEDVPRDRVAAASAVVDDAQALLVAGSSLTVFSGYRFVRQASKRGIPVIIATMGPSRGDGEATLKIDAPVADVLPALAAALG
jgi:NAD-dependent deacetylase sirtuin 4